MASQRILGYDNFAGSSGTDLVGRSTDSSNLWSYMSTGPARVDGTGKAYDANFNGPRMVCNVRVPASYRVSCVSKTDLASNRAPGPACRIKLAEDSGIYLDFSNGDWQLRRYISGTATSLVVYTGDSPTTEVAVDMDTIDDWIYVYFNGVLRITWQELILRDPGFPGANIIGNGGATRYLRAWTVTGDISMPARNRALNLYAPTTSGGIVGTLSSALDAATLVSTGTVKLQAALGSTLADVAGAGAAGLVIQGAATAALGDVTSSAAGALKIQGAASPSLGDVTLAATGTLQIHGTTAASLDDAIGQGAAGLQIHGVAGPTLADVTAAAAGSLALQAVTAASLADLGSLATGALKIQGASSTTLGDLSAAGAAGLLVQGTLAATLADATLVADALLVAAGTGIVSATLSDVVSTATGALKLQGDLASTLGDVLAAGAAALHVQGMTAAQLGDVTLAADGLVNAGRTAIVDATLDDVVLLATATLTGDVPVAEDSVIGSLAVIKPRRSRARRIITVQPPVPPDDPEEVRAPEPAHIDRTPPLVNAEQLAQAKRLAHLARLRSEDEIWLSVL